MLVCLSFVRLIVDVERSRDNAPNYVPRSKLLCAYVVVLHMALAKWRTDSRQLVSRVTTDRLARIWVSEVVRVMDSVNQDNARRTVAKRHNFPCLIL